jgi:hypothetical protein
MGQGYKFRNSLLTIRIRTKFKVKMEAVRQNFSICYNSSGGIGEVAQKGLMNNSEIITARNGRGTFALIFLIT